MCALQENNINVVHLSAVSLSSTHVIVTNSADCTGIFIWYISVLSSAQPNLLQRFHLYSVISTANHNVALLAVTDVLLRFQLLAYY
jgi:hypothetical protein